MAEQILFNFVERLVMKLGSYALSQIGLAWGVEKELKKLKTSMTLVRNILLDAEEKQEKNRAVKEWLQRLKELVYEADDLVDEFATEALRKQVEVDGSKRREVRNFFSQSNTITFRYSMGRRVKDVRLRLEEILTDMKKFELAVQAVETKPQPKGRDETYSFVRSSEVVGRESEKEDVIQLIMGCNNEQFVSVIPIVGMGGLGKTTLAKLLYSDPRVESEFEHIIWVCVSDDFDVKIIIRKILKVLGDNNCDSLELEQLRSRLQERLSGSKFFLVLDNVWNEDPVEWIKLRDLLMVGDGSSVILVTTRSEIVASVMGTVPLYDLRSLSDDECLSVFVKWAFNEGDERQHQNLVNIGREIVKKCSGVPLAARTLGCLLYMKTEERDWLSVRDNELWAIKQNENDIMPALRLSSDQMPTYLKQCFAYCSLFKKDKSIDKWMLIYLWMAQGFIRPSEDNDELEDIGERYVNELVKRSFLELNYRGPNRESYTMHDLVHDLAQFVSGSECLKMNPAKKSIPERLKHVSFDLSSEDPQPLFKLNKLRTFLCFNENKFSQGYHGLGQTLTSSFRYLRSLQLCGNMVEVPSSIGDLKHLRSFLIDTACGMTLPSSLGRLLNLQYLHLQVRWFPQVFMFELPEGIGKLINLRYLSLYSSFLTCLPDEIGGLKSLQRLRISIALQLRSLPEGIQHLSNLRYLEIRGCPLLTSLPSGMRYLTALEELYISTCDALSISDFDLRGLTSLRILTLYDLPELVSLPQGLQESAATLERLRLVLCSNLTSLSDSLEYLTTLQKLEICECRSLLSLPERMQYLTKLQSLTIKGCPELSARCISGREDWYKIEHVPELETDYEKWYVSYLSHRLVSKH
ncbi:putative disease resistance RPP13-like protein 1 [Abeliophyllum distichum]|uniref:Disease resistance RPP13-like protein 1 n=1 Tax=Abeliophyllum distichum TaxID=126358 RepID=A0ABD1VCA4_9LAMI